MIAVLAEIALITAFAVLLKVEATLALVVALLLQTPVGAELVTAKVSNVPTHAAKFPVMAPGVALTE